MDPPLVPGGSLANRKREDNPRPPASRHGAQERAVPDINGAPPVAPGGGHKSQAGAGLDPDAAGVPDDPPLPPVLPAEERAPLPPPPPAFVPAAVVVAAAKVAAATGGASTGRLTDPARFCKPAPATGGVAAKVAACASAETDAPDTKASARAKHAVALKQAPTTRDVPIIRTAPVVRRRLAAALAHQGLPSAVAAVYN